MVVMGTAPNQRILVQMEKGISSFFTGATKVDPPKENIKVDDVVILKDNDTPRNQWKVCRVAEALPDEDGLVREVRLEIGSPNLALTEREVSLCPCWRDQSTS